MPVTVLYFDALTVTLATEFTSRNVPLGLYCPTTRYTEREPSTEFEQESRPMWEPVTFEDRLLARYLEDHPGELFLEVPVGGTDTSRGARRIDGVLVPGETSRVWAQGSYTTAQVREAIEDQPAHLLEAKSVLNRNVIGQVQVGEGLLARDFDPAEIVPVAVCSGGNTDLEWYCRGNGVEASFYPDVTRVPGAETGTGPIVHDGRRDVRNPPDPGRQRAFLSGWTHAVHGRLYKSVRKKKTHTNMGNLFGWIYGDQPEDFRLSTWERYVNNTEIADGSDGEEL